MAAAEKILIIIPCYNEESAIGTLLTEIRQTNPSWDTVVIDDGSTDGTLGAARKQSGVIRHMANLGIGGAIQTGIMYARDHDYDLAIQVDGDGQHPPSEVESLIQRYRKKPSNLIIGSRFIHKQGFQSTNIRRLGISVIRFVLQLVANCRVSDPTSGLRLLDRNALQVFARDYPIDFPEPISIVIAKQVGLSVDEVSVHMRSRMHGASSIQGNKTILYMVRVIFYIIFARIRKAV